MPDDTFGEIDWNATPAHKTIAEVEEAAEKALEKVKAVKEEQDRSFEEVMGMIRASYMMITGVSQAIGGDLPQVFSSIFSMAISSIATYKAIAAAMAASGVGAAQASLMFASLITAIASLMAGMAEESELARRVTGLNTSLMGISNLIGSINF